MCTRVNIRFKYFVSCMSCCCCFFSRFFFRLLYARERRLNNEHNMYTYRHIVYKKCLSGTQCALFYVLPTWAHQHPFDYPIFSGVDLLVCVSFSLTLSFTLLRFFPCILTAMCKDDERAQRKNEWNCVPFFISWSLYLEKKIMPFYAQY